MIGMAIDIGQLQTDHEIELIHFEELPSTSAYLKEKIGSQKVSNPILCIADAQTKGYGQQGRSWQTTKDALLFSLAIPLEKAFIPQHLIELVLTVRDLLVKYSDSELYLKWPNDIWSFEGKAAGMLIESIKSGVDRQSWCVIGIGVNLMQTDDGYGWVEGLQKEVFLRSLMNYVATFTKLEARSSGFLISEWQKSDLFQLGEQIDYVGNDEKQTVSYQGLTNDFELQLQINSETKRFASGTISIRKK